MKSTEPKRWRIVGLSDDGLKVTLGRYETEDEAERDRQRYATEAFYRDLQIIPIDVVKPASAEGEADEEAVVEDDAAED